MIILDMSLPNNQITRAVATVDVLFFTNV